MIIRKQFRFEGSHIVRNCSSDRCKFSLHGHSYIVEVFVTASGLDNGQMLLDFGLMKGPIKDFIDSFDHAHSMWNKESAFFQDFIGENSARWVIMPVSPSAESYALMFFKVIDAIINATSFANGERNVSLYSVRVHETSTGYAEAFREDLDWVKYSLGDIMFSDQIKKEWTDPNMLQQLIEAVEHKCQCFYNKEVTQQL